MYKRKEITKTDLYEDGFFGKDNSKEKRLLLQKKLRLPENMTANLLLEMINIFLSFDEYKKIAKELEEITGIKTLMQDERGTTITAHNFLNTTNTRGKKRKNVVDEVAATIILQDFLDSRKP